MLLQGLPASATLAVIAGPIAEAMHGVPEERSATAKQRYLAEALDIVDTMDRLYLGNRSEEHCAGADIVHPRAT